MIKSGKKFSVIGIFYFVVGINVLLVVVFLGKLFVLFKIDQNVDLGYIIVGCIFDGKLCDFKVVGLFGFGENGEFGDIGIVFYMNQGLVFGIFVVFGVVGVFFLVRR